MARSAIRVLVVAGGIGLVAAAVLAFTRPHPLGQAAAVTWVAGAVLPTYTLGALLFTVRPDQLIARWLAILGSSLALQTVGTRTIGMLGDASAGWWLAAATGLQVVTLASTAAMASLFVLLPDPAQRHAYQRRVLIGLWSAVLVTPLGLALTAPTVQFTVPAAPGTVIDNPLFVPALAPLQPLFATAFRWRGLMWLVGVVVMLIRYRAADPATRRTFRWPLAAASVAAGFLVVFRYVEQVSLLAPSTRAVLVYTGWVPSLALVSASVLVALLRHRLIDFDLAVRRAILHRGVMLALAVLHLGTAGALGWVTGQRMSAGAGVLVTLAAVALLQPVRRALEQRAGAWLYGPPVQGGDVLRRVGQTLQDAYDVDQIATHLAGAVADGLGLEWARVTVTGGEGGEGGLGGSGGSSGAGSGGVTGGDGAGSQRGAGAPTAVGAVGIGARDPARPDVVLPLTHGGETVGALECGPKRDGDLSERDEELLRTVAGQGALAIRNARLASELEGRLRDLAASRSRILTAQMAERRRIERNIHDGVQQEIVAAIAKLRLARNQLSRDADEAAGTLAELQDDTRHILEQLRELSRGIHPTVLSDRGLADAVDTQARHSPLDVHIDASPDVRSSRYAEDVEATAYYVISEGLTNVLKHAGTDSATVRLSATDGHLVAEVVDHGRGFADPPHTSGSGLVGLRDRVESIGGRLHIDSRPAVGTTLRAELPARAPGSNDG